MGLLDSLLQGGPDRDDYQDFISRYDQVGEEELAAVPLVRHEFHGEWNYTLHPAA